MTRNQNRDRIRAARATDGTNGLRFANGAGNFTVTFGLAAGDFSQRVPNLPLKRCAVGQIKWRKFPGRTSGENIFQCGSGCAMPAADWGRDASAFAALPPSSDFSETGRRDKRFAAWKIQFSQAFFRIACDKLTIARGDRQFDQSRFHSQPVSDCGQKPESGRATKKTARRRKR